jgi:hypothetical protein
MSNSLKAKKSVSSIVRAKPALSLVEKVPSDTLKINYSKPSDLRDKSADRSSKTTPLKTSASGSNFRTSKRATE